MPLQREENLSLSSNIQANGKIGFSSPSNIALVKYWGKYGDQLPQNPSISFTLDHSRTEMILEYSPKGEIDKHKTIDLTFTFEGKENKAFGDKITAFLTRLLPTHPYLGQLTFNLSSTNTFPHSAGIASSASSMSALALCICTLENRLFQNMNEVETLKKASYLARLGSGSACRSRNPRGSSRTATQHLVAHPSRRGSEVLSQTERSRRATLFALDFLPPQSHSRPSGGGHSRCCREGDSSQPRAGRGSMELVADAGRGHTVHRRASRFSLSWWG